MKQHEEEAVRRADEPAPLPPPIAAAAALAEQRRETTSRPAAGRRLCCTGCRFWQGGTVGAGPARPGRQLCGGWRVHDNAWHDVESVTGDDLTGWIELGESGFHALIGWIAGPDRLRRVPDDLGRYVVRVTCEEPDGPRTWTEARTAADQAGIDADIDAYLTDAGAPPRPPGYRWFLQQPANIGERDLEAAVDHGIDRMAPAATHPSDMVQPIRQVLADLYGR